MCGITGFAERNHKAETARRIVKGMADLITYRGPDGEGYYVDDQVALGHRRLSIIDLEGCKQPMFNEDQNLAVIFNGEIYNFQELTAELMRAGHIFATRSDTEVLLHGYEQWGKEMLQKLRGMFTFAIWDRKNETLFCARDHFGIKPFYYYQNDAGELLFGSEIKSFLAHPGFKKELRRAAAAVSFLPVFPRGGYLLQGRQKADARPLAGMESRAADGAALLAAQVRPR